MKKITINGTGCETAAVSLEAVLLERGFAGAGVIAELNGAIVGREVSFAAIPIREGDSLNLFRIVAGG